MNETQERKVKQDLQAFYQSEASKRDSDDWITRGGNVRVPESRSAHYFVDRKVTQALRMTGARPDARIAEIGCSFGQMTFLLTGKFREVVAVDLSPESIDLVRRRAAHYDVRNLTLHAADAENLSMLEKDSFDAAFSFSVLRYIPHPERALSEIHRILKPGGHAAVDFPNKYCPWFGPLKKVLGIKGHIHDRLFSASEAVRMMEAAGFTDITVKHLLFTTRRLPVKLLPIFKIVDRILEPIPGIRNMAAIIMVSGRKG